MDGAAWGYRPKAHLGKDLWEECKEYGTWMVVGQGSFPYGSADWALIVRWLTPEEAAVKWGPITEIENGSRGGFESVTYGTTKTSRVWLKPTAEMERAFWSSREPETYEWVVTLKVFPKTEEPKAEWGAPDPKQMRARSDWYADLAVLYERMFADDWKASWSKCTFERIEAAEGNYPRERLKRVLSGLDVRAGQLRQERRKKLSPCACVTPGTRRFSKGRIQCDVCKGQLEE